MTTLARRFTTWRYLMNHPNLPAGVEMDGVSKWLIITRASVFTMTATSGLIGGLLAIALYREGGIRGCEIGTVMFGMHPDGTETPGPMELVRLAIPRRVYTQSHIDYVIEVVRSVAAGAAALRGYRITEQPAQLRPFPARFEPI